MTKNITCRAAAFIINNGKLLFAKHASLPLYYVVGGGIEENETSEQAVIREIFEETGLKLEVDKLAIIQERIHEVNKQKHHEIVFFYTVKEHPAINNILDNSFTDQGTQETLHWLPIDDLKNFNIIPPFLKEKSFRNMREIEHVVVWE